MTECFVLRINTSTPTVWLHWPTCRPSSDVCTSTLPSASSGEGKKHNYRCLDVTGFIVINSRVFFLTRCWFQIKPKPKPKPYWSFGFYVTVNSVMIKLFFFTKLFELNHCLVQTGSYNWTLICQVCFGLLYNHRLRPLLFYCKNLSQQKKKKLWGPTYIIYILYLLRGPFSPRTIVYIKDDKNAFQSDWRPSHEDIHSIIHLETLLTACMWKMSLHTTGNDVRDEPKFLFHLLKSTAPLVCIISSWCVFPFY